MKNFKLNKLNFFLFILFFLSINFSLIAQETYNPQKKYEFTKKWRFGGGLGLGFGSGYTDIMIAPSAIYQINEYFAAGVGLQGSYINSKNRGYYYSDIKQYQSWIYGGSLIALANPIPLLQLSAELEQLRVNTTYTYRDGDRWDNNFWNTALFLGIGYHNGPVTIGIRYNVLYKEKDMVYGSAYMPFVRIYF